MEICFLTVLETGSPRSASQFVWVLMRILILTCRLLHFQCILCGRERTLVSIPLIKAPVLLGQGSTLRTSFNNHLLKACISSMVTLEIRA